LSLPAAELAATLRAFAAGTALAGAAGFEVIQIHAAHGYLLSLLLHPDVNRRVDAYASGSDWLEQLVGSCRGAAAGALIGVRLSVCSAVSNPERELGYTIDIARRLVCAGVDILDISGGFYTLDRSLIYPSHVAPPRYLESAVTIAKEVDCLVSVAGGVHCPESLTSVDFPQNVLVGLGRALIADSRFAEKWKALRWNDIRLCRRTGQCHYFTRGATHISCGVNPALGLKGD
jgi:2,4-dienoyl-CoA reductase-like NADH-dependent reductase (Old Yellow Enzyme family)